MKVRLQPEALNDLREIAAYIDRANPRRAASFAAELREKIEQLSTMGRSFRVVPRYAVSGLRRRVHGAYQILYLANEELERVDVLRVLHSSRNLAELLRAFE
ncbi:type II toxin-antitoxin system RelE/ParE family toxin [Mitsuaria sp. GD03876]|uniref:type II toxin-antitoxin system RelE/ParE family toxin n=1 Tax=Mitsuaria sp. GD03876 TaxID=2975399 RepID=UPI00244B171D|nr:type II toxin-antitoxin system RelE/ParE family toxin [Mitsuaria sp. GD03876]MDH0864062.1 type II toxin-antitoxin system RelE/ParE family toxin [Mitsuaria sp. GD03876]